MNDFYKEIEKYITDEASDHNKYFKLAEQAPTEKARKILMDIGREEKRHHDFLQEILEDGERSGAVDISKSEDSTELSSNRKVNPANDLKTAAISADLK